MIEAVTVPKIGRCSPLICFVYAKIWKRFTRKSFFINVFNPNRMFLKLIIQCIILLYEKVIETITVFANGCSGNVFFWYAETNDWMNFRRKLFSFSHLILIWIFWLLTLSDLNMFTMKHKRNHHSCRNRVWQRNIVIDFYYCLNTVHEKIYLF